MSKRRYPMRVPRFAAGIRAQNLRSSPLGRSWWAMRWMESVERMNVDGRFGRGRAYAASGQVLSVKIDSGSVIGEVQGMRSEPYRAVAAFRQALGRQRERIVAELRREPMLVARLLADDLPTEVEEIFSDEGLSLFPGGKLGPGKYDVTTSCSCPDYANPCKHSMALLLLLGEEISRRPSALVELRGIRMTELYEN